MSLRNLKLKASQIISSEITLPGSKSISNRVLLMSALSSGNTNIKNLLFSNDTEVMISSLNKLGININCNKKLGKCIVTGSPNYFPVKKADLFIGNSGTTIRPLAAILAFNEGNYSIHGTNRMHERPIGDLVDSLKSIGAKINYVNNSGYPPLNIDIAKVNNNSVIIKSDVSSQFLTSLLIASPILAKNKKFEIKILGNLISKPYVEMTLELLKIFSVEVIQRNNSYTINPNQKFISPLNINIEGDASSASYFFAAAAISGKKLKIKGIGKFSIQGDIKFLEILKQMGGNIKMNESYIEINSSSQLKGIDADLNHIPDAAMTLAIVALFAEGPSTLRNIGSWRVKETDRLSAMSKELKKLGAKVTEGIDFLIIEPPKKIKDATIDTYDDHRMAMCFSLASINSPYKNAGNITINDPECVAKTFPNFFEIFKGIVK